MNEIREGEQHYVPTHYIDISTWQELQKRIENTCFQAYCEIHFKSSSWEWGSVKYRLEESGIGYEMDFRNLKELAEVLNEVLDKAKTQGCRSI